jgi:hypothetical protein
MTRMGLEVWEEAPQTIGLGRGDYKCTLHALLALVLLHQKMVATVPL